VNLLDLYYEMKPLLPWRLRLAVRRVRARYLRHRLGRIWPIDSAAAAPPPNWKGWPEQKRFALILTHDVEGPAGLAKCLPLVELERALGFRSSFNFVPEGEYRVGRTLRDALTRDSFEVGVHDLHHDGKLFRCRDQFEKHAVRINDYLAKWKATGFRAGFMLHKLHWLHSLDVLYDASTFDVDPFEPQPEGVRTIFPFWVQGPHGRGFVELPYTLAQDITLFLVLRDDGLGIWKRKIDWIAEHGGMVLLDTHPDYMDFQGDGLTGRTYPARHYREVLDYVRTRYAGQFWHALPRELATFAHTSVPANVFPSNVSV
jgi:hypothetical protein